MMWRIVSGAGLVIYGVCLALLAGVIGAGSVVARDELAFVALIGTDNELFTVDIHTGVLHNLTHNSAAADVSFSWSPDGSQMAFVRRTNASGLYLMDARGRNIREWHEGLIPIFPQWSPDGSMIAFLGNRASGLPDVFVMPAGGGIPVNLTDTQAVSEGDIDWSPDSKSIAVSSYTSGRHILLVDVATSRQRKLIDNATLPRWSPDGSLMSFVRLTGDKPVFWLKSLADGSEAQQDTGKGLVASFPAAWSPDSNTVALIKNDGVERLIYLLNIADGTGRDVLAMTQPVSQVLWSPDGTRLALMTDTAIYLLEVNTGSLRQVVDTGFPIRLAAWRPG